MKRWRYQIAALIAVGGFAALFAVLPSTGAAREIHLAGFLFRPDALTLKVGDAVTVFNDSDVTHTATCRGCRLDTRDLQPGLQRTVTFTTAGRFQLYCRYHEAQGMRATVEVKG